MKTASAAPRDCSSDPGTGQIGHSPDSSRLSEQHRGVAGLTEVMLSRRGFGVTVAYDAESAWDLLQRRPFDLVVADVMLPGMSGTQLRQRLSEDARLAKLPVVFVMAHPNEIEIPAFADPSLIVVLKPFEPDDLASAIRQKLEGRHSELRGN